MSDGRASSPALGEQLEESRRRGFLGPGPVEAHLDHSRAMSRAVESVAPGARGGPAVAVYPGAAVAGTETLGFLDLGSGGGVPGLYLASRWRVRGALLDASRRRCDFLRQALATIGAADRVDVIESRAEEAGRDRRWRGRFEVVVARAFGGPATTAECATAFLAVGGILVVSEPPAQSPGAASRWDPEGLATLGLEPVPVPTERPALAAFRKVGGSDRWPRRDGIPAKRPLWRP